MQSAIPDGGTPFGFIIYADKTKLSSFGTQKGYPWVVALCNLDESVRSGAGPGASAVVGWLPVARISSSPFPLRELFIYDPLGQEGSR